MDRGVLVIPAAFGEIAGDFILDLSSPKSVLHIDVALGKDIVPPQATAPLRLAGETIPATFDIASLDSRSLGLPSTISGLIGADVLAGQVLDIRFNPCRIWLWDRRPSRFHAVASLPIRSIDGVPTVRATISDGRTALAGRFAIDTGTAAVRLPGAIASLSRPAPKGVDPASRLAPPARLDALGLAGEAQRRLPAALADDLPAGLTGAIGTAAWSRYDLRIDFRRRRLELAPATRKISARRPSRSAGS